MSAIQTTTCYLGDDLSLEVTATWQDTGLPVDLTGAKIVSTCRRTDSEPPAWTKRNLAEGGSDSEIAMTNAAGGVCTIAVTAAESAAMQPTTYQVDAVALLSTGKVATLATWRLIMQTRPTVGAVV